MKNDSQSLASKVKYVAVNSKC